MRRISTAVLATLVLGVGSEPARAESVAVAGDADPSLVTPVLPSGSGLTRAVSATRATHLRFVVPDGATPVLRARLRLDVRDPSRQALAIRVARATWDERTLTGLNAPHPAGEPVALVPAGI